MFKNIVHLLIINKLKRTYRVQNLFKMHELIALLVLAVGVGGFLYGKHIAWKAYERQKADLRAIIGGRFTGVYPLFPRFPWSDNLEDDKAALLALFKDHGNTLPKEVVTYPYNAVLSDGKSTAHLDMQDSFVLFCHDYLKRVKEWHEKMYAADPKGAAVHLQGQKFDPYNLSDAEKNGQP